MQKTIKNSHHLHSKKSTSTSAYPTGRLRQHPRLSAFICGKKNIQTLHLDALMAKAEADIAANNVRDIDEIIDKF